MATAHDLRFRADAVASHHLPAHAFDLPLEPSRRVNCEMATSTLNQDNACSADPRLPNPPPCTFPASTLSTGPLFARPRRRPMSMADIPPSQPLTTWSTGDSATGGRTAPLPQFSFNPGASSAADPGSAAGPSPPITPNSARLSPSASRPAGHGHRRGGSEFVGGSIRDGNSIAVFSTSPTTSENGLASCGLQPPPPRRGHRRGVSGAISTNDLSFLQPPPDFTSNKGSSAPNSPTTFSLCESTLLPLDDQTCPLPQPLTDAVHARASNDTEAHNVTEHTDPVPDSPQSHESGSKQFKLGRARVGFSDTLEFIPRPSSLVSNDTSSTVTARHSHKVSGSISSTVSAASLADRDSPAPLARSPTVETVESRPSTAGAILERTANDFRSVATANKSRKRRNSISTLLDNATLVSPSASNPGPTKTPRRWSFFGLEPFLGSMPASKQRSSSSSSSESVNKPATRGTSSDHESDFSGDDDAAVCGPNDNKKQRKKSNRKRRVKGWAGAILPLRSNRKRSKMLELRPPTPPASVGVLEDDEDENVVDVVQAAPETDMPLATPTVLGTESRAVQHAASPKRRSDEDGGCPMIDLDAALGPFNTPLPRNAEWDAAQQAAGNTGKRRLHSAQGMKGFSGPGMHYHRRTESAPDLPPFDPGRSTGINRFGSSSTMADVFEEDEDDDVEVQAGSEPLNIESDELNGEETVGFVGKTTPSSTTKTKLAAEPLNEVVVSDKSFKAAEARSHSYAGTSPENASAFYAMRPQVSRTSLHEDVIVEEPPSIILRGASIFGAPPSDASNSATSSPRLPPSHRDASAAEMNHLISLNNAMVAPVRPYSPTYAPSYPSPRSPRSPMSIDAQRIPTAPSSVTDETSFYSLLLDGEPGPDLRISVDYDIQSLTSSTSTRTRESAFMPNARMSQPTLRAQRPMSVSSAAFGRRRSSLVSLSRLINSSHGERSKLSMEVTLDNDGETKRSRSKNSKTNRLGRMMQFWKPNKDSKPA